MTVESTTQVQRTPIMEERPPPDLRPTYVGYISTTMEALMLFEACLGGQICHAPRRPHDRERQDMIRSGHVFIYEEHSSGIKRWTDGVSWSPSRILGNFLIYRELDKPFAPGEKKRAMKKRKSPPAPQGITKSGSSSSHPILPTASGSMDSTAAEKDQERALVGSLVDSYPFKNNGLVKKTISITWNGVPHHLVSYYNCAEVTSGRLIRPSQHPDFTNIAPRPALVMAQNFRSPLHEVDWTANDNGHPPPGVYQSLVQAHGAVVNNHIARSLSVSHIPTAPMTSYPPPGVAQHNTSFAYNAPGSHFGDAMPGPGPMANPAAMAYTTPNQDEYVVGAPRRSLQATHSEFHEFEPNATHFNLPVRRHSTFEGSTTDFTGMSMASMADHRSLVGNHSNMVPSTLGYIPNRDPMRAFADQGVVFSTPRQMASGQEFEEGNGDAQAYTLAQNQGTWGSLQHPIEEISPEDDPRFMDNPPPDPSQQWTNGSTHYDHK